LFFHPKSAWARRVVALVLTCAVGACALGGCAPTVSDAPAPEAGGATVTERADADSTTPESPEPVVWVVMDAPDAEHKAVRYHRVDCQHVRGARTRGNEVREVGLSRAIGMGRTPCKHCDPARAPD